MQYVISWVIPGSRSWTFPLYVAIGIDTNIEVIVVSLTTWEAHHSPRAVNETTMTEIGVSITILSWWNQINDE